MDKKLFSTIRMNAGTQSGHIILLCLYLFYSEKTIINSMYNQYIKNFKGKRFSSFYLVESS